MFPIDSPSRAFDFAETCDKGTSAITKAPLIVSRVPPVLEKVSETVLELTSFWLRRIVNEREDPASGLVRLFDRVVETRERLNFTESLCLRR